MFTILDQFSHRKNTTNVMNFTKKKKNYVGFKIKSIYATLVCKKKKKFVILYRVHDEKG